MTSNRSNRNTIYKYIDGICSFSVLGEEVTEQLSIKGDQSNCYFQNKNGKKRASFLSSQIEIYLYGNGEIYSCK